MNPQWIVPVGQVLGRMDTQEWRQVALPGIHNAEEPLVIDLASDALLPWKDAQGDPQDFRKQGRGGYTYPNFDIKRSESSALNPNYQDRISGLIYPGQKKEPLDPDFLEALEASVDIDRYRLNTQMQDFGRYQLQIGIETRGSG